MVLALRDNVTGIAGRALFEELLLIHIAAARRERARFAVIYADIERLARANALLDNRAGDALLRLVAERVRGSLRASDAVGRVGPDEIAAILPGAGDFAAIVVAEKVRRACVGWFAVGAVQYPVRVTVGSSVYPDEGESAAALLRRAEAAMYRLKVADRQIFGPLGRVGGSEYVLAPQ